MKPGAGLFVGIQTRGQNEITAPGAEAFDDAGVTGEMQGLGAGQIRWSLRRYTRRVGALVRPRMAALMRARAEAGQQVLVVTASAELAVRHALEGYPVTVIGTRFGTKGGAFTGEVAGAPCYGRSKVAHLLEWSGRQDEEPRFIEGWSDSLTDLPMLELAERRVWICGGSRAQVFRERDPQGEIVLED